MELISAKRRRELIFDARNLQKIELRDDYGMDASLLNAWRAGDHDAVKHSALEYAADVAARAKGGWIFQRLRVVSEPLSEYQQMAVATSGPSVNAGEQLRWLPRKLVSALPLPGNDCFVVDNEVVIFNVLGGDNQLAEIQLTRDEEVVSFCRNAFEVIWPLATPHHDYKPENSSVA